MKKLSERMRENEMKNKTSIYDWILKLTPVSVFITFFMIGAVLLVGSYLIHNGSFVYGIAYGDDIINKQVGYAGSLNWLLGSLALAPIAIATALSAVRHLDLKICKFAENQTIVYFDYSCIEPNRLKALWDEKARRSFRTAWRVFIIINVIIFACFWLSTGSVIYSGEAQCCKYLQNMTYKCDWSVASVVTNCTLSTGQCIQDDTVEEQENGTEPNTRGCPIEVENIEENTYRLPNFIHSLLCSVFACDIPIGLIAAFFTFLSSQISFFSVRELSMNSLMMLPNVCAANNTNGLAMFEALFEKCIIIIMAAFVLFYLVHLQNTYLRSLSPDLWDFIRTDVFRNVDLRSKDIDKLFPDIFAYIGALDMYTCLAGVGCVGIVCVFVVIYYIVRETVKDGIYQLSVLNDQVDVIDEEVDSNELRKMLVEKCDLVEYDEEKIKAMLTAVTYQPGRKMTEKVALGLAVIVFGSVLFYKAGLIFVGLAVTLIFVRYISKFELKMPEF